MLLKFLCILVVGFLQGCFGMEEIERVKRGASIYPVFGGANSGHMGAEQNSYLFLHDATPFIQYLGGGGGGSTPSHSGGGQSSSYSFRVQAQPGSGSGSGALESNYINSYNLHSSSQPSWSPSSSSSGWQPPSPSGYGGGHYIAYYGLTTPNFASTGQSVTTHPAPAPRHDAPSPDASSLLHSAQSSFNSQTAVFNALTAGSRPRPYKG